MVLNEFPRFCEIHDEDMGENRKRLERRIMVLSGDEWCYLLKLVCVVCVRCKLFVTRLPGMTWRNNQAQNMKLLSPRTSFSRTKMPVVSLHLRRVCRVPPSIE